TTPPGATLLETLEALGMTQSELAERMGRPTKTVNEIINGKAAITPETALQLERVLGVPARFWSNRERHYREHLAQIEEEGKLQANVNWLNELPVKHMINLGWVRRCDTKVEQIRELLHFFGVASPVCWH